MYGGSIDLKPPLLYAISFIFLFMIGGLPVLLWVQLLPMFRFMILHLLLPISIISSLEEWDLPSLPGSITGILKCLAGCTVTVLANIAWGYYFIGFNLLYFPLFVIGIQGMPRRYFDYLPQFHTGHVLSTIGGFILFCRAGSDGL